MFLLTDVMRASIVRGLARGYVEAGENVQTEVADDPRNQTQGVMLGIYLLDESSKSGKWLPVLDSFPPSTDCYTPLISIEGSIPRDAMQ